MIGYSHIIVGLGVASVAPIPIFTNDLKLTIINIGVIILFSLAPDLDHPKSMITRTLFPLIPVSYLIYKFFGHRTLTHSFIFWFLLSVLLFSLLSKELALLASLSYLSHIMADVVSMSGVKVWYPFSDRKLSFGNLMINGIGEKIVVFIFLILFIFMEYKNIFKIIGV
jgi:inner membrane protein